MENDSCTEPWSQLSETMYFIIRSHKNKFPYASGGTILRLFCNCNKLYSSDYWISVFYYVLIIQNSKCIITSNFNLAWNNK